MKKITRLKLFTTLLFCVLFTSTLLAAPHVYQVVEATFNAKKSYENPYIEVDLWVTLNGPGGTYKVPAFWDGGNVFRVRLVATEPGTWSWSTGNQTGDSGLDNKTGSFKAIAWSQAEKQANPNRRGFIRVAANKHTLEYADGTPFFYTGDTWWCAFTKVYAWDNDNCLAQISFQKAIALRKAQGFNGLNIIACFPSDRLNGIWNKATHGEKVSENGITPFEIADPNDETFGVDFTRIHPQYWQKVDRKMKHLWDNGFAPFIESVRRHEQWYNENPAERNAFVNYIRYLWARYGCYNLIFSWVHWDWDMKVLDEWKAMINMAYRSLGEMPYGQPRTAMAWGSSLSTWCVEPGRVPLGAFDVHNVSNKNRDYVMFSWLRDIFYDTNPKPGINVEPYYPRWHNNKPAEGLNDCTMARFLMYGSVLNGGFAGHAWGDTYYAGVATKTTDERGEPIPPADPHKNGFNRWCAASMGKLKDFILDSGHDYRTLKPATLTNLVDTHQEWRVLALSPDQSQGLGFIAANHSGTDIQDLNPNVRYKIEWWNIDDGGWSNTSAATTDNAGRLIMPSKPNNKGWAFRILRVN
jgi:hypothetical protein